jgi:hypothetical protein
MAAAAAASLATVKRCCSVVKSDRPSYDGRQLRTRSIRSSVMPSARCAPRHDADHDLSSDTRGA